MSSKSAAKSRSHGMWMSPWGRTLPRLPATASEPHAGAGRRSARSSRAAPRLGCRWRRLRSLRRRQTPQYRQTPALATTRARPAFCGRRPADHHAPRADDTAAREPSRQLRQIEPLQRLTSPKPVPDHMPARARTARLIIVSHIVSASVPRYPMVIPDRRADQATPSGALGAELSP